MADVPQRLLPIVLTLALAACGSGSDADTSAASSNESTTTSATAPTTAPSTTVAPSTTPASTTAPSTSPVVTEPPATTTTVPPTAPPQPWAPIAAGPYEVGVSTITLADPERPLTVDVWFPLRPDADDLAPQQYTLLPGVYYESGAAVAATAEQLSTDATFPLVVYSHGSGGLRYIHSSYTEALASHGYIVAAPDHTGNTAIDRLAGTDAPADEIAFVRPTDVRRVIDAFIDTDDPAAGAWAVQVDAERIAVTGHSFGGFTAIASVTGFSNSLGEIDADARVDAIIPIAPATGPTLLPDEVLARVDVPMLVLVGTDDVTTPVDPNVTRLWDLTDQPAYRVELVAGEHQTFTDLCAYTRFLPTLTDVPDLVIDTITSYAVEGCSPGDIDDRRAAEITNTYAVTFLDEVFRDGPGIVSTPPDDVLFASR